ncbi:sensor histidine kinase [Nonomuraea angiospora]|uniref:Signal transduction histidine kinase n=1 Tax=Nonomuraea angiospora TaxID=46172 RepID=A0ABR9MKM7_9ACTN|nr:sensor histidine kinase [Nonomuraea angiospora]MBE1593495.1 signal transduction histidine kinase [Nonomuraea angiospora]
MGDPAARWPVALTAGPYALLALLTGVTVAVKRSDGASLIVDLVLCGLTAAWMLGVFTLRPAWRRRAPVMAVFCAVLILLSAILAVRDPWFGCFTPVGYFYAFRLLRWPWQPVGVGAMAVVAGTAQAYDVDKSTAAGLVTYGAVVAANAVPMCAFAWFARRAARQNEERERALQEAREANRRLAASLAENAALHERLLAQARDAGVQGERQRMAREIHDTLAQGLTGIVSQLRAAEHAGDDPAAWRRHVAAATKLARESLSEARRSVHALRPEPLRSAMLSEALAGVAERWSALHEIPVQVTTTGTARPIRPEAEAALLRIAQEALANVAKHARATRVGVTLSYLEHEAALDVRDDGGGFDLALLDAAAGFRPDRGGFGLIAMRQRMESLSGTLQVESEPGAGTGISARVPAERAEVGV